MLRRIKAQTMADVFRRALVNDLIRKEDTSLIFYDMTRLTARIEDLVQQFPPDTLHAVAIKANPLYKILQHINPLGLGLEAASLPELELALSAGVSTKRIVFDSPVKTREEIRFALQENVHLNIDNFQELARVAEILDKQASASQIGLRINPQVGTGRILITSVAGDYSKFGIPVSQHRSEIIAAYRRYPWLTGIHLHVGSQGCDVELLTRGIRVVLDLVLEINSALGRTQIRTFDLGGGLPVAYRKTDPLVSMQTYAREIRAACPELFQEPFKLITEFGRYLHANTGWVASRVEYVKHEQGMTTAMIHVGADLLLRVCYDPDDWHHDVSVMDCDGTLKTGPLSPCTIAGPLCFAGDMIAVAVMLPPIEPGDYILVHDTGAYTLSMWSRYNSRTIPRVVGYQYEADMEPQFRVLKERERFSDILSFWS